MRDFFVVVVSLFFTTLFLSCNSSNGKDGRLPSNIVNNPNTASGDESDKNFPVISFITDEHDFGKVIQGEKVTYTFKFENTGTADLIITDVSANCGCTTPDFTNEPVKPGATGLIKVTFDSNSRRGFQNKAVTVVSNTQPNSKILKIKAMVIVPENN